MVFASIHYRWEMFLQSVEIVEFFISKSSEIGAKMRSKTYPKSRSQNGIKKREKVTRVSAGVCECLRHRPGHGGGAPYNITPFHPSNHLNHPNIHPMNTPLVLRHGGG